MTISNGKIRALALCGILSPIIYVITVAIGGFLDPSYSHVGKTVSKLVERGSPNPGFTQYYVGGLQSSHYSLLGWPIL
jgi:hypothetical protein